MFSSSDVEVSYTETIKPSSPTPRHLIKFKLSLIDNYTPPFYVPFVFFYNPPPASKPAADILKSSLAHALTLFYPFAGRLSISDSIPVVLCNDEGVPFSVATTASGSSLDSFLCPGRAPEIDSFHQFLPFRPFQGIESAPQIAIRATVFSCGGIVIGVCLLHKIIDAHSFADFMKLWAAVARGGGKQVPGGTYAHDRAATSLFPARHDDVGPSAVDYVSEEKKKSVTRRFVFDAKAIAELQVRARSEEVPNPTRSEAISGLVWKSAVSSTARALSPDGAKPGSVHSVGVMAMGLRSRIREPWADYTVGNLVWGPISLYDNYEQPNSADETNTLQLLVHKLRSSIKKVNKEFMEKLQRGDGRKEYLRNEEIRWKEMTSTPPQSGTKVMYFAMSSLIGMRLYDVDFGWGRPFWISFANFAEQVNNALIMMDSPSENGVEAWITMHKQEMTILENDPELLSYTKNNPYVPFTWSARL